jgi:hypothetical protein
MKTYGEWRYSFTILELSTRWRWVTSFTPGERAACTHWIGGWEGPRAELDVVENRKISCPCGKPTSAVQPVARRCTDWAIALNFYMLFRFLCEKSTENCVVVVLQMGITMSNKCLLDRYASFSASYIGKRAARVRIYHSRTLNLSLFLISTKTMKICGVVIPRSVNLGIRRR